MARRYVGSHRRFVWKNFAEVNISTYPKWRHSGLYFSSCRNIQNYGVLCRNIGQAFLHVTRPSRLTIWIWPMSLECFLKPWKMRQNNELHADLVSLLFNCWGSCRNITVPSYCIAAILCRASFRVCAEILVLGRNIHLCNRHWRTCSCNQISCGQWSGSKTREARGPTRRGCPVWWTS